MRELLKLVVNNSNNCKTAISTLYDKLQTQLRGLESLGVTSDKYAAMLYPLVVSALPGETLKAWQFDSEIRLKMARSGMTEPVENSNGFGKAMVSSTALKKIISVISARSHGISNHIVINSGRFWRDRYKEK